MGNCSAICPERGSILQIEQQLPLFVYAHYIINVPAAGGLDARMTDR
jgi:hypothetical protein